MLKEKLTAERQRGKERDWDGVERERETLHKILEQHTPIVIVIASGTWGQGRVGTIPFTF